MAALTLYFLPDTTATGSTALASLQDGGSAPSTANATAGWAVGTNAANNYSTFKKGVKQARTTFAGTVLPPSTIDNTNGNAFRTQNTYNGTFSNANWSFAFNLISTSVGSPAQQDAIRIRVFRSTDATGQTGLVELTGATQQGTTITGNSGTAQTSTVTWAPGGTIALSNEYLFVSVAMITVVAGSNVGNDWLLRTGSTAAITTPNFTPNAALTATSTSITSSRGSVSAAQSVNGQSSTSSVGTLGVATDDNLVGTDLTASQGTGGVSTSASITGQEITSGTGTVAVPTNDVIEALTGSSSSGAQGTITPAPSVSTTGQTITSAAGSASASQTLVGTASTVQTGSILYTRPLTGSSTTLATGTLTDSDTLSLIGQGITSSQGALGQTLASTLTGTSITSASGTLTEAENIQLVGQTATSSIGSVLVTPAGVTTGGQISTATGSLGVATTRPMAGSSTTSNAGTLGSLLATVLTGQASTSSQSTMGASGSGTASIMGQVITSGAGTTAPSTTASTTGQAATGAQGSLGLVHALTGQSNALAQGSVTIQQNVTAALTGTTIASGSGSTGKTLAAILTGQSSTSSHGTVVANSSMYLNSVQSYLNQESIAPTTSVGVVGSTSSVVDSTTMLTNRQHSLSGEELLATHGRFGQFVALVGSTLVVQDGHITRTMYLSGQQMALFPESVAAEIDAVLTGLMAVTRKGHLTPLKLITLGLSGSSMRALAGMPTVNKFASNARNEGERVVYITSMDTLIRVEQEQDTVWVA